MIEDLILSDQDLDFFHLKKIDTFMDCDIYAVDNERYLLKDLHVENCYKVVIAYEVKN